MCCIKIRWVEHVSVENTCKTLLGKSKGKRLLGRSRSRRESNFKEDSASWNSLCSSRLFLADTYHLYVLFL